MASMSRVRISAETVILATGWKFDVVVGLLDGLIVRP
jgi:hypothetical protein